jgi:two-component system, OmpR family, aerobic respiration control sensor histidine kinase ArcB
MIHMPCHVYWKDKNGRYLGCNDRQAQSLGLHRGEDVVGKTDFELPWEEELARRFWENDQQVFRTGESKTVEELAIVNGREAVVLSLKVPLKNSHGQIVSVLGIYLGRYYPTKACRRQAHSSKGSRRSCLTSQNGILRKHAT